jgi:hypothetical protein
MLPRRFFRSDEVVRAARTFRDHPWVVSFVPAVVVGVVAWAPLRGTILGVVVLLLCRFVLGPYVLRLARTPSR